MHVNNQQPLKLELYTKGQWLFASISPSHLLTQQNSINATGHHTQNTDYFVFSGNIDCKPFNLLKASWMTAWSQQYSVTCVF